MDSVLKGMFFVIFVLVAIISGGLIWVNRAGEDWTEKEVAEAAIRHELKMHERFAGPVMSDGRNNSLAADDEMSSGGPESTVLRVSRTITDNRGRSLDVIITGRTLTKIQFLTAERSWEWPIADLSPEDKKFARTLPIDQR